MRDGRQAGVEGGSLRVKEEEDKKMQTGRRNVVCKAGCG